MNQKILIRLSADIFVRIWQNVGYVLNKVDYSDRVVNQSGAVFLKALSRSPCDFDQMCEEILENFRNVDLNTIKTDALLFYRQLESDGYLLIGSSAEELDSKERIFSYRHIKPRMHSSKSISPLYESSQGKLEKQFRDKPQLVAFQIELTSRCNERCVHCYIPHENKTTDINNELFYSVLKQCRDMDVLTLTLSGGEPMLHPHFLEYLKKAKEYDFAVNVLSNLTLMDEKTIKVFKSPGLVSLQVSLYSMIPEIHDAITHFRGSFEKTKKNILRCIDNDIPLQISAPCMKENLDSIEGVFDWGDKINVRVESDYNIMAKYNHEVDNLEHRISVDESERVIRCIIGHNNNYRKKLFDSTDSVLPLYDENEAMCGVGQSFCCMIANGNVYPCAGWQGYVCGNLNSDSLANIWYKSERMNFLRSIRKKDFPECKECPDRKFCHLCMGRLSNENTDGSPFRLIPYFCQTAHVNRIVAEKIVSEHNKEHL